MDFKRKSVKSKMNGQNGRTFVKVNGSTGSSINSFLSYSWKDFKSDKYSQCSPKIIFQINIFWFVKLTTTITQPMPK